MFLQLTRYALLIVIALVISVARARASEGGHLIPLRPNFDVGNVPHAKTYARLCEEKLFTESSWIIRYHGIGESAETGLSISRQKDRKFFVTVKQAQPQLGSTVFLAFDLKLDVNAAVKTLKIEEARVEISEAAAMAVRDYWIWLLRDRRPYELGSWSSISKSVRLFAKTGEGKILAGRLPPDAFNYRHLKGVEDIVEDLMRLTVEKREGHDRIFHRIGRTARESRRIR